MVTGAVRRRRVASANSSCSDRRSGRRSARGPSARRRAARRTGAPRRRGTGRPRRGGAASPTGRCAAAAARTSRSSRSSDSARCAPRLVDTSAWISSTITVSTDAQPLARVRGQQQEQRLGRGDQDVGRVALEPRALGGRACRRCGSTIAGAWNGTPRGRGHVRDAGQRRAQVALDVHGQRLERRHVEDAAARVAFGGTGANISRSRHGRETRPASCRCRSARGSASTRRGRSPASPAAAAASGPSKAEREPRRHRRMEEIEDVRRHRPYNASDVRAMPSARSEGPRARGGPTDTMGDAAEGLIDADLRIQERMEELEQERKAARKAAPAKDPDQGARARIVPAGPHRTAAPVRPHRAPGAPRAADRGGGGARSTDEDPGGLTAADSYPATLAGGATP